MSVFLLGFPSNQPQKWVPSRTDGGQLVVRVEFHLGRGKMLPWRRQPRLCGTSRQWQVLRKFSLGREGSSLFGWFSEETKKHPPYFIFFRGGGVQSFKKTHHCRVSGFLETILVLKVPQSEMAHFVLAPPLKNQTLEWPTNSKLGFAKSQRQPTNSGFPFLGENPHFSSEHKV